MTELINPKLSEYAFMQVLQCQNFIYNDVNKFCASVLKSRGGRIGSGMGMIMEALWGYYTNKALHERPESVCELAWFPEHQYHDFACIEIQKEWDHTKGIGGIFNIEAKSMNIGADESKAHFDVLRHQLEEHDTLLVLVWKWIVLDRNYYSPQIVDSFFGLAMPLVDLRDQLHIARGGSFVDRQQCPDGCQEDKCTHHGEPLNAEGKRERLSGPESCRPSQKVSYSANFGGLVRMLKTRGSDSRRLLRRIWRENDVAGEYIQFIHRVYPDQEFNNFTSSEIREAAKKVGIINPELNARDLLNAMRQIKNYYDALKSID